MKQNFTKAICFMLLSWLSLPVLAQTMPEASYSFDFTQKLSPVLNSPNTRIHTSAKPFVFADSLVKFRMDSILNYGADSSRKSWVLRKLFNEHLISINKAQYTFYADYLPDVQVGRDFKSKSNTWLNTRSFQAGLTIGRKFSFYTNFFENQALFTPYIRSFIDQYHVVPGQSIKDYYLQRKSIDYSYSSATLSYSPIKQLNITLAYDKNFIGDGYRSLLLSDISSNYTSFKLTGSLGNIQYTTMWAYMMDPLAPKSGSSRGIASQYKWGVFQYLDWNISNRVSLGIFQSVLWAPQNADGSYRGFNFGYASPVIFLRPIESSDPVSPDKTHLGLTGKYKFLKNITFYGQFLLDDFKAKEFFSGRGYWGNKWASQLGFKTFNTFNVPNLHALFEFNTARPYTYSHFQEITSYSNNAQPLAHPFGANFKEILSIWSYSYKRFDFRLEGVYGTYGLDMNGLDYGQNIFTPYDQHLQDYGNEVGQGLHTKLYYGEGKVAFLLNPKYNLKVELGGVLRKETNMVNTSTTAWFTIGLRSSFRNIYYDF
jgi:hypothetical protein